MLKIDYLYEKVINGEGQGAATNNGNVGRQTVTIAAGSTGGRDFVSEQNYEYDSLNRLRQMGEKFEYEQRPTAEQRVDTLVQTYDYDRFGNRTFNETYTSTLPKRCGTAADPQVCPADRLIHNPSINPANNRFTAGQGYSYDAAGNLIQDAQGRQFTYDAENKQTAVKNSSGQTLGTYFYDGDGKRVKKLTGAVETIFVYDAGGKIVAEYINQSVDIPWQTSYLTADTLGSPRVITNQLGAVTSRRDFLPFGEELATPFRMPHLGYAAIADKTRQKFTSYERDNETDLDFAQNRYYNKNHGRFTTVDPALSSGMPEKAQSWNRYSYTLNNPLKFVDPTGLIWGYKDLMDGKRQFQWFDGDEVGKGFTAYTQTWWVGADTAYHLDPDSANWYGVKKTDFFSNEEWSGLQLSTNNDIQNKLSDYQQRRLGSGLIYEIKNRPEVKQMLQLLEIAENIQGALEARSALTPTERVSANKETKKLIADIAENGIQEPLKYVKEGGLKYVVDGNHRLLAAHALDLQQIPTQCVQLPYRGFKTANDLVEVPRSDFLRPLKWLRK